MKHARETGCNRIDFHVSVTSPARIFYEKLGAIDVSERDGHLYYRIYKDVINKVDV